MVMFGLCMILVYDGLLRGAFGRQYNRKASAEKVITGGNSIEIENCPVKSSYAIPCPAFQSLKIISLFSTPKQKASPFKKSSKIRLFRIERWHWTFSTALPCAVALISASPHINSKLNSGVKFAFFSNQISGVMRRWRTRYLSYFWWTGW